MIGLVDIADRHGGDPGLVADAVRERGLKHSAVDRARPDRGLTRRHVHDVDARRLQHPGDLDRVQRRNALVTDPDDLTAYRNNRPLREPASAAMP